MDPYFMHLYKYYSGKQVTGLIPARATNPRWGFFQEGQSVYKTPKSNTLWWLCIRQQQKIALYLDFVALG